MLLSEVAEVSEALAARASRRAKIDVIARLLGAADPADAGLAASYLAGVMPQGRIGVGWATLRDITPDPAPSPVLTLADVDRAVTEVAALTGSGSEERRRNAATRLFEQATAGEQRFLTALLLGEVRHGALEGVVSDAVAVASGAPAESVRRALMVGAGIAEVATAAVEGGSGRLGRFRVRLFRPIRPMLAESAPDPAAALARTGPGAVEVKYDGARIQVHRRGRRVAVFTRNLRDVTDRTPEVAAAVRDLPGGSLILDGEALVLGPDGRPRPFQESASRFGTESDGGGEPLTPVFFDLLYADGRDRTGMAAAGRRRLLEAAVPAGLLVPRIEPSSPDQAAGFMAEALAAGHEGIVVKAMESPYAAGRRGAAWVKVKPVHTLDLVVLAAEWGHGRRQGYLSNLHLGARDEEHGGFVMLGKTFKGLTDEMLVWQTERLLRLEERRTRSAVFVRPEQVVEIAFDGVQSSTRYPGGVTLRFARVRGYREDKTASEADTLAMVEAIHRGEVVPSVG